MPNSYRIRTKPGVDSSIKILIDQEFEYLEILSLKILQSQIYTRMCSDYGVIVGRVSVNNGFGVPNAKVSVFIPLDSIDENNPVITDIYPYRTLNDLNEDGYRYNLLPYEQQHSGHNPTGTFFSRQDVLTNPTLIEVYDKYYKYTAITNDSGDYMIFGVPVGSQTIVVDIDLSDIGEFSLSPQDLIRMGIATEDQVSGNRFKSSTNLRELPQIVTINRTIEVEPLWGQPEICNLGITRTDFDLTGDLNIDIRPTAIFMGSLISNNDDNFIKRNCKSKPKTGNLCELVTGPGEILAIRQTIQKDIVGRPLLERFDLEQGGQVIDDNGTWLIDVPMNLDYVVTNEFGEQVLSDDPKIGIPTKGKYRFKIKWNQSPSLTADPIKRGYYLVPNIKEYGWTINTNGDRIDPINLPTTPNSQQIENYTHSQNSYAFSVDWNEYGDTGTTIGQQMIQEAINCEDRFYEFQYNKVYTVSQLITRYKKGFNANRIIGVKDILDTQCESENYKFPTNDGYYQSDIIYLLFTIVMFIIRPTLYVLLINTHVLSLLMFILNFLLKFLVSVIFVLVAGICNLINLFVRKEKKLECPDLGDLKDIFGTLDQITSIFTNIQLPVLSYPACELCSCEDGVNVNYDPNELGLGNAVNVAINNGSFSVLTPFQNSVNYDIPQILPFNYNTELKGYQSLMAGITKSLDDPTISSRVPGLSVLSQSITDIWDTKVAFTTSLTIYERLNLFNTKAKFFEGVNQIKSCFNSVDNSSDFHYDNVITLLIQPAYSQTFSAGNIISFQDPKLSKDPNLTGYTPGNLFGVESITGQTINNSGNIYTVSCSDPTNPSNTISVNYNSTQDPNDATYARFPIDVEYFQVITGMTLNEYATLTGNTLSNSLPSRFIFNSMRFYQIDRKKLPPNYGVWTNYDLNNDPLLLDYTTVYNNFLNQRIVFLVRGVDPNSTRSNCKYDLSKLFGYNSWNQIIVESGVNGAPKYKLNIPIQGGYKNVEHTLSNSTDLSFYSNTNLYYDSYHFVPAPSVNQAGFTAFTSNLPSYYSSVDNNNLSIGITSGPDGAEINPTLDNRFTLEFTNSNVNPFVGLLNGVSNVLPNTRGYYPSEIIEGGSAFFSTLPPFDLENKILATPDNEPVISDSFYSVRYIATKYPSTTTLNYNLGINGNQIVMRSDRLPTSTTTDDNLTNSFPLHANSKFSVFLINDDGVNVPPSGVGLDQSPLNINNILDAIDNDYSNGSVISKVIESSQCGNMVPLDCYSSSTVNGVNNFGIKPNDNPCFYGPLKKRIFSNGGCYVLVTTPLISLLKDFLLLTEWTSRLLITFGACRNIFGHIFTNNWVNGVLYSFTFRNDSVYNNPFGDNPNQANYKYCKDVVTLHGYIEPPTVNFYTGSTYNFYYRSSPYDSSINSFIGANPPKTLIGNIKYGGNEFNLNYPTTLMDLGPINYYTKDLIMSSDYDGYVVNKLVNTSFSDVSELLNLFILVRLANQGFLSGLINGNNIFSYFSRNNLMIDGDYAQAISVNSELGVAPFEPENYPDNSVLGSQNPIYINTLNTNLNNFRNQIFGIFFSSDTQTRDFISPKRTIINPSGTTLNKCTFNNFRVFTQKVPFYQWEVKTNNTVDSIFGNQINDWYTIPLKGNEFFAHKYQSLDRVSKSSRYTRTNNLSRTEYFKGYIYSVDSGGNINASVSNWDINSDVGRAITVGAPYHFYFGLRRGKSAFDRFTSKWIDTNRVIL